jgi:hypothetical protein
MGGSATQPTMQPQQQGYNPAFGTGDPSLQPDPTKGTGYGGMATPPTQAVGGYNPTMGTGYGGMGAGPDPAKQAAYTQSQQPNIFQQSAGAMGQAQQTLTGLSQFQPTAMQAATAGPTAIYGGATVAPSAQMQAPQLGQASTMQGVGAVQGAQAPSQIAVDQLRTTDMGEYMSPYTQQVIERGQADIERQRQLASQDLGASASAAKAFGGSRHGVAEGTLAGEYGRMGMDFAAQQRQRAFDQAQQAAQYDIGQTQAARTLASQQRFQASQLGQQAREMAAARDQAARAGNMQAANQFATQQAGLEQSAGLANMQALNAQRAQQAGLTQSAGLASMGALNTAAQQQAAREQAARATTYGGQFQGAGIQQGAAGGLANLGQQMFGMGQDIQGAIGGQGQFQRGLQQSLLDRAMGQYGGATGAPMSGLGALSSILSGLPNMGSTSTSRTPFNPLGLLGALL